MNKILKRVISSISVLAMCMCALPVSASAVTYKQGDVDGDGTVTAQDALILQQFLRGRYGAGDAYTAERLDVDRSGIIEINDVNVVLDKVVSDVVTTFTATSSNVLPAQSTETYCVYNADTCAKIDEYNLYAVNNINSSSVNSRMIVGDDNRSSVSGNTLWGIVKVINSRNTGVGTGFVVDEHTILTSAHVLLTLYTPRDGLQFMAYDQNGNSSQLTPLTYHIPNKYIDDIDNMVVDNDYALITVEEDLSDYMCFDLGVARKELNNKLPTLQITGYSGELGGNLAYQMVTGYGYLCADKVDDYRICYNVDTIGGTSGAPVYVNKNGKKVVIGIHRGVDEETDANNNAKRIDTNILHFVYNNPNL